MFTQFSSLKFLNWPLFQAIDIFKLLSTCFFLLLLVEFLSVEFEIPDNFFYSRSVPFASSFK